VLRALAITGTAAEGDALLEGLRILAPGGRLVIDGGPSGAAARLSAAGARVLLDEDGTVVAEAPGRPVPLTRNAVR
jgi:hypothetical protein